MSEETVLHVGLRYAEWARALPLVAGEPPSLGSGDPVALAALRPGETVLDLGSGPGRDLLAAARLVGPGGRAVGVDFTAGMRERARVAAAAAGLANVSVLEGDLQALPLPEGTVDVVISNCVINLVPDKAVALAEARRVLAPGGRLAVVDTAFESEPPPSVRRDIESWARCVGGALVGHVYVDLLERVGFVGVNLAFLDESCSGCCACGDDPVRSVAVTARKAGEPPAGPVVRPAVPADAKGVALLLEEAGLPGSGLRMEDAFVALESGRLLGAVALERYGRAALFRSLVVAPQARDRGLGVALAARALDAAASAGIRSVYLLTQIPSSSYVWASSRSRGTRRQRPVPRRSSGRRSASRR